MNREQRRAMGHRGLGQPTTENTRVNINYGADHDGHVLLGINRPIDNLRLTVDEAQNMADNILKCIAYVKDQKAAVPPGVVLSTAPSTAQ